MNQFSAAVARQMAEMPEIWDLDKKRDAATAIVTRNAIREVDRGVRAFVCDAMPNPMRQRGETMRYRGDQATPNTAMMPPSRFDQSGNFMHGGYGDTETNGETDNWNRRRNNNHAADQYTAPELINFVQAWLRGHRDDEAEVAALLQDLADLLDAEFNGRAGWELP